MVVQPVGNSRLAQGVIKFRLKGACDRCPMASMTLKSGIERALKESIPEVKEVVPG